MGFPSLVSSHIVGLQALGEGPGPPLTLQPRCQASLSLGPGVELPGGSSLAAVVPRGLTGLGEGRWSALTWRGLLGHQGLCVGITHRASGSILCLGPLRTQSVSQDSGDGTLNRESKLIPALAWSTTRGFQRSAGGEPPGQPSWRVMGLLSSTPVGCLEHTDAGRAVILRSSHL